MTESGPCTPNYYYFKEETRKQCQEAVIIVFVCQLLIKSNTARNPSHLQNKCVWKWGIKWCSDVNSKFKNRTSSVVLFHFSQPRSPLPSHHLPPSQYFSLGCSTLVNTIWFPVICLSSLSRVFRKDRSPVHLFSQETHFEWINGEGIWKQRTEGNEKKQKHSVSKSTSFIFCGLKSLCQLNIKYRVVLVAGQISQEPTDKSVNPCSVLMRM